MKRILTSIWFLALIVTIPVIIWLPPVFDKYKAEQIKLKYNTSLNMRLYFKDLDSDGTKEEIKSYEDFSGRFAIQYFKQDKVVPIDQLNFSNAFNPVLNKIYFHDLNKDGYTELYVFLTRSDSLFLHWFQPYPNRMNHEEVKFITKLGTYNNGLLDARIHDVYFKDLDQDGFNEIYCALDNGYSIWPRSIFRIDLRNNTITQSPDDGINDYKLEFEDLDGDGQTDIIVDNSAGANIKDEAGNLHTDNFTWLVAYNANFDALFPPIRFTEGLNNFTEWRK